MSNNFLTANISGLEMMQPADEAFGYNVNRIAAALNGLNPIPLIVGPMTVQGPLIATGDLQAMAGRVFAGPIPPSFGGVVGDLVANRGGAPPGTGAVFFGSSTGGHNLYYDGTKFLLTDGLTITGALDGATTGTFSNVLQGNGLQAKGQLEIMRRDTGASAWTIYSQTDGLGIWNGADKWFMSASGNVTMAGDLAVGGRILMSVAISKILAGTTSLAIRDSTDGFDLLKVSPAGHIATGTNAGTPAPTITNTAGNSGISNTGNDRHGRVIFTTPVAGIGAGGVVLQVNYRTAYASQPFVLSCQTRGQATVDLIPYYAGSSASQFQVVALDAMLGSTQYAFDYIVEGDVI
jgi:hypothetical protein